MTTRRQTLFLLLAGLALGAAAPLPPPPRADIAPLIGQYGTPDRILTIYEAEGRLFADGAGLDRTPLARRGAGYLVGGQVPLAVETRRGRPVALVIAGARLSRRDFGAEVEAAIQAKVKADPAKVRAEALAASPPIETGKRAADLVDLRTVDPRIRFDIRYATTNNFMGFPLYERAGAYLQRPAAEALGRAQQTLAAQGYGLLIHDGYRPWSVTKMFWDATPPESRAFVADPAEGSRHNRGCAVDLTLYELKSGKPVEMPGRYDEMSGRSAADFVGGTSRQRALRQILRAAMEAEGFTVLPEEWWHFDYKDWPAYGIGAATFTELANAR